MRLPTHQDVLRAVAMVDVPVTSGLSSPPTDMALSGAHIKTTHGYRIQVNVVAFPRLEYRVATRNNALDWQRTTFYKEGVWVSTTGEMCWSEETKGDEGGVRLLPYPGLCLIFAYNLFGDRVSPDSPQIPVSCFSSRELNVGLETWL